MVGHGLDQEQLALVEPFAIAAHGINRACVKTGEQILHINRRIDATKEDVMKKLIEYTDGNMATVVIDATGSLKAINNSFKYIAHGGRYILIGLQKGDVSFSHPEFHKREGTLLSSRNATKDDFDEVIHYFKSGNIDLKPLITHRVPFDLIQSQFRLLTAPENNVLKALILC